MATKFGTQDWIQELCDRLNGSESYAQAAATWEGDQLFCILADDNYPRDIYYYIDLQHGKASNPRLLTAPDEQKALFKSTAPYTTWRKVLDGRLDPIQAMFSNKIKLVGSLAAIQRTPKATYQLVKVAAAIETDYAP